MCTQSNGNRLLFCSCYELHSKLIEHLLTDTQAYGMKFILWRSRYVPATRNSISLCRSCKSLQSLQYAPPSTSQSLTKPHGTSQDLMKVNEVSKWINRSDSFTCSLNPALRMPRVRLSDSERMLQLWLHEDTACLELSWSSRSSVSLFFCSISTFLSCSYSHSFSRSSFTVLTAFVSYKLFSQTKGMRNCR